MFEIPPIVDEHQGWVIIGMICLIMIYLLILAHGEAP